MAFFSDGHGHGDGLGHGHRHGHGHHRRSIRLNGCDDTAAGAYFVSICAQDLACLSGGVIHGALCLNDGGRMAQAAWDELPVRYAGIDAYVIMPNHMHGIVVLVGAPPAVFP